MAPSIRLWTGDPRKNGHQNKIVLCKCVPRWFDKGQRRGLIKMVRKLCDTDENVCKLSRSQTNIIFRTLKTYKVSLDL